MGNEKIGSWQLILQKAAHSDLRALVSTGMEILETLVKVLKKYWKQIIN